MYIYTYIYAHVYVYESVCECMRLYEGVLIFTSTEGFFET